MLKPKTVFLLTLGILNGFMVGNAPGQNKNIKESGTKIVTSPLGAMVFVEGEYNLAGRAPYTILQPLYGNYHIKASKRGFENYSTTHFFKPGAKEKLAIRLTKKTRLRSTIRSIFFPGWGQYYSDQKLKGIFLTATQLVSAGILIHSDSDYQKSVKNFENAVNAFRKLEKNAELRDQLIRQVLDTRKAVDDKYEIRKRAAIVTASIYIYNILDALIFFPSYHNDQLGLDLSVEKIGGQQTVGIGLKAKF